MNKKLTTLLFVMTALALLVSSCGTPAQPTEVESAPPTDPPAATSTPAVEPTKTPKPTKEPPKTGPLATAAALSAQVTLVPPTPIGGFDTSGLAAEDYVGITKQAWYIVEANYVRDNFNGVDWDAVYDEYVVLAEDVTSSEELWDLLAEMIRELRDNHSRHVRPGDFGDEFELSNSVIQYSTSSYMPNNASETGTGLDIWPAKEDEYLFVWDVCSESSAASAGIVRGDVILAVDGQKVVRFDSGFDPYLWVPLVRESGGAYTLTIQSGPDEDPRDVQVGFGPVSGCDDWYYEIVSEDPYIGYIRLPDFGGDAAANVMRFIQEMEAEKPLDGLILDERHNPGGNSDETSGIFADGIVGTEGPLREDKQRTTYRIRGVDWNDTTPLVVLTDGSSHSAADYFPAAMKELERATIIGMNSAGNTEGIVGFNLADGSIIRLAVTILALNDGTLLEGIGVTPHIEVPLGMWGLRQQPYDVQLQIAIDFLSGK